MRGLCRATGDRFVEVVVEALDLDEQACERAARLTDGEADAPSLPSRTFCRLSIKGSLGHGAHARSTTSLVGKAAFGGPHAEKLSLEVDASHVGRSAVCGAFSGNSCLR